MSHAAAKLPILSRAASTNRDLFTQETPLAFYFLGAMMTDECTFGPVAMHQEAAHLLVEHAVALTRPTPGLPVYGVPGFKLGRYHHLEEAVDPETVDREPCWRDDQLLRAFAERYFPDGACKDMQRLARGEKAHGLSRITTDGDTPMVEGLATGV